MQIPKDKHTPEGLYLALLLTWRYRRKAQHTHRLRTGIKDLPGPIIGETNTASLWASDLFLSARAEYLNPELWQATAFQVCSINQLQRHFPESSDSRFHQMPLHQGWSGVAWLRESRLRWRCEISKRWNQVSPTCISVCFNPIDSSLPFLDQDVALYFVTNWTYRSRQMICFRVWGSHNSVVCRRYLSERYLSSSAKD